MLKTSISLVPAVAIISKARPSPFVLGVDALGAVPPIKESHVEMDAAWALYESILKIRMGHAESALVYGFGKIIPGRVAHCFVATAGSVLPGTVVRGQCESRCDASPDDVGAGRL